MLSTPYLLKALLLASCVSALPQKRGIRNTLHFDLVKVSKAGSAAGTPSAVDAPFTSSNTIFFVEVGLGTPTQYIYSQLDTGSSNLVVFPSDQNVQTCSFSNDICNHLTFQSTQSTSYVNLHTSFTASYGDGSGGSGNLATDTLNFEGTAIDLFEFGDLTTDNSLGNSVFGTGYATNEATTSNYPNLPQRLVTAGAINSPVFSLWLNSLRGVETGSMLYGGIDSQKYCGNLATLPIEQENGAYVEFVINLASITATDSDGNSVATPLGGNTISLLDSGTNSISVPQDAYNTILSTYDASPASGNGFPQVACSLGTSGRALDFAFAGGLKIPVPLSQVVASAGSSSQTQCDFFVSVNPAGGSEGLILGSPFLSSAYVVYDLGNNEIHMAPSIFDATSSNIVAVGAGTNAVPSIAGPACPSSTTSTTSASTTTSSASTTTNSAATTTTSASTNDSTTTTSTATPLTSTSLSASMSASTTISASTMTTTESTSSSASTTGTSSSITTESITTSSSAVTTTTTTSTVSTWMTTSTSSLSISTITTSISGTSTLATSWDNWGHSSSSDSAWANNPPPTFITPAPSTAWSVWSAYPVPSDLSYSTVVTTIYVCPSFVQDCGAESKTATVSTIVVAYTTSTIYTSSAVLVTAACPQATGCASAYYTTSWSLISFTTTVYPYGSLQPIAKPTAQGVNGAAATMSTLLQQIGVTGQGPTSAANNVAATSASTWSKINAASNVAAASASTWSGNNAAWSTAGMVKTYTGGADTIYRPSRTVHLLTGFAASVVLMLLW